MRLAKIRIDPRLSEWPERAPRKRALGERVKGEGRKMLILNGQGPTRSGRTSCGELRERLSP